MTKSPSPGDLEALFGVNAGYVEKVYQEYIDSPDSVGTEWRTFFESRFGPIESVSVPRRRATAPAIAGADGLEELRGVAQKIAQNMAQSLSIPTATSTRVIPVKVLEENRLLINQHLASEFRGKTSFTHLVAYALVQALRRHPALAVTYVEVDGKPHRRAVGSINLGLAIDIAREGAARSLVVPNIKGTEVLDFRGFLLAYDAMVVRARTGTLAPADFADTTCTLTNPGTLGTVSSLPRLMVGQAFILATGTIDVPAEYQGASLSTLTELGISKVMTVTSTYDHRVIQGADSGEFLATLHALLLGEHGFYEAIFAELRLPHAPFVFGRDRRSAPGSIVRGSESMERSARVMEFIRTWRVRGYVLADLDPLVHERRRFKELELTTYGLTIWDLDREFLSSGATPTPIAPLREILAVLRDTYTRHVGVEYMHIADPEQREWIRAKVEGGRDRTSIGKEAMVGVLDRLVQAEAFERFLHTRFVGHKRFSLEGGETLIPTLGAILDQAADAGLPQAVLGMAHRGRLNVLAHVLGKPLEKLFSEFEGYIDPDSTQGSGDVKYHLGATGQFTTLNGKTITVELACNPSHLEAVNPVVEGIARARVDEQSEGQPRFVVLPILVHGDAAFAGQGVVAETLNMSGLRGYRTGGTIHVIVNNQIGYTTAPADARSTPHCTDVAKAIQAPIFHVNGDDPLAAVTVARFCFEYRQRFHRDVVIDIVCYRRHGHNEGDEPSFTQPLLYRAIEAHRSVHQIYGEFLVRAGILKQSEVDAFDERLEERLKSSLDTVRQSLPPEPPPPKEPAAAVWGRGPVTAMSSERLFDLQQRLLRWPATFTPHPKVLMLLQRRLAMLQGEQPIDFACAETLAFASLVSAGCPVRLSGQDSGRGTFSQRHSVLLDNVTGERFVPLNHLVEGQARYVVIDSLLSEEAVLGFEYGYSISRENALVLWEAQFGDFCNGAQIQIDQFIAPGEAKWGRPCGLVLLLPHGYDGQGPEHSSARLERFLQLCAEGNLRVANPSTPAQYFHLLRKQALDPVKKPLVVMTQKSLLRQKIAGSRLQDLAQGGFAAVIAEPRPSRVRRVVLCTGKVYYDLLEARSRGEFGAGTLLVRLEQLYPWPEQELAAVLEPIPGETDAVWCQEEPANMGAWVHVRSMLSIPLRYVGRPAAASPATGSLQAHKRQQAQLVRAALE